MIRRPTSVLVVEDNPGDARLIQEYLRDSPTLDADLTIVETLEKAIDTLHTTSFDVVLLDLSLSDSSGLGSVRILSRTAERTPILVISGNDDLELILQTVQAGAQDYLPKQDASTGSLSRAISNAIERQAMMVERDTLTKIGRTISSNLDIDVVFGQFADQVRTLIPNERMVICWGDEEEMCLVNHHAWGGLNAPWDIPDQYIVPIQSFENFTAAEDGVIGWGAALFGELSAKEMARKSASAGYTSAMFAPLPNR